MPFPSITPISRYKKLPKDLQAAFIKVSSSYFEPTEENLTFQPKQYKKLSDQLTEIEKNNIDKAFEETEKSYKSFSAY